MKTRRRVTWKDPSTPLRAQVPHPEMPSQPVPEDLVPHLVVGSMWRTSAPFSVLTMHALPRIVQHEYPYVQPSSWGTVVATGGQVVVYAGPVRVDEAPSWGRRVRSHLRHTFLMGGSRFMVFTMDGLEPLQAGVK